MVSAAWASDNLAGTLRDLGRAIVAAVEQSASVRGGCLFAASVSASPGRQRAGMQILRPPPRAGRIPRRGRGACPQTCGSRRASARGRWRRSQDRALAGDRKGPVVQIAKLRREDGRTLRAQDRPIRPPGGNASRPVLPTATRPLLVIAGAHRPRRRTVCWPCHEYCMGYGGETYDGTLITSSEQLSRLAHESEVVYKRRQTMYTRTAE